MPRVPGNETLIQMLLNNNIILPNYNLCFQAETLRNGATADATPSPSSSVSESLDIFPESPMHRYGVRENRIFILCYK